MNIKHRPAFLVSTMLVVLIAQLTLSPRSFAQSTDYLYIGDTGDNSVKRFGSVDSSQGKFLGAFVKSSLAGLHGPRGLVFNSKGNLIVSDQNVGTSADSDILAYDQTGRLLTRIISHSSTNAPVAARGIVLWTDLDAKQDFLFVADFTEESQPKRPPSPGKLLKYKADGTFVGSSVAPTDGTLGTCGTASTGETILAEFHPRGVVLGPDGLLYVSNYPCTASGLRGQVLKFDPKSGNYVGMLVDSSNDLNRPEGLVFGPDGNLYITSFRSNAKGAIDNDKILVFQGPKGGTPGAFVDEIDFYPPQAVGNPPNPRTYAQALLFGPGGKLFIPISGDGPNTGSVRRYDVSTKLYDVFVPSASKGGPLQAPWYLTFGKTNPGTLAYAP